LTHIAKKFIFVGFNRFLRPGTGNSVHNDEDGRKIKNPACSMLVTGPGAMFNERLRELCANEGAYPLERATSLDPLNAGDESAFRGNVPRLKQKSVYPPPIEAEVLGAFDKCRQVFDLPFLCFFLSDLGRMPDL